MPDPPLELRYLDPSTLTPQPANPWQHPPAQSAALAGSLDAAGWAGAALLNLTTGRLIDGHLRRDQAIRRGEPLPTLCGRWDEPQERLLLATVNPIGMLAQQNDALLADLQASIAADIDAGLLAMPAGLEELLGSLAPPPLLGDPDAIPERAPPRCAPGDLWELGSHRLLCGDSTKAEDVARLMDGAKADFLVTDPPYVLQAATDKAGKIDPDEQGLLHFIRNVWLEWLSHLHRHAGASWFCNWQTIQPIRRAVWSGRLKSFQAAVWFKGHGCTAGTPWTNDFEMVLFYGLSGFNHQRGAGSNVREISWHGMKRENHPAEKPVEAYRFALTPMGEGDVIIDPFLGSGTTLIAAEQLSRRCFGMEIEPRYCDVALERWLTLTGIEPRKVE